MVMSVEILLLALMGGITLLAYMIAINAHGPVRLSLSYLLATLVLAGTVWVTVQYVNSTVEQKQASEMRRLQAEKDRAEDQLQTQRAALDENKGRMNFAGKLNAVITRSASIASSLVNKDLQDRSVDLNTLIGRAVDAAQKAQALKDEFGTLKSTDSVFTQSMGLVGEGLTLLNEATYYYKLFYYSEDSAQEEVRGKILRQKAQAAYEKFQKASTLIAALGS
jgi:membrane protein implicated in regulation of membrane protease activity